MLVLIDCHAWLTSPVKQLLLLCSAAGVVLSPLTGIPLPVQIHAE